MSVTLLVVLKKYFSPALYALGIFWFSVSFSFFALRVLPGDAISAQLRESGAAPQVIAERRAALNLDDPVIVQYGVYLRGLLQGDLGVSLLTGQPVVELLVAVVPATIELCAFSLVFGVSAGIALGLLGLNDPFVMARTTWLRHLHGLLTALRTGIIAFSVSVPSYWLGTILIWLFAVQLGMFPSGGAGGFNRVVLPGLVLGVVTMGGVGATTSVLAAEAFNEAYVRTAHSKGLSPFPILWRHILPAIFPGVVVYISTQMVFLLSGAVITEILFSRPGVGRLLLDAVLRQDFPVVQGVVVWTTMIVLFVTTAGEWAQRLSDPRLDE